MRRWNEPFAHHSAMIIHTKVQTGTNLDQIRRLERRGRKGGHPRHEAAPFLKLTTVMDIALPFTHRRSDGFGKHHRLEPAGEAVQSPTIRQG